MVYFRDSSLVDRTPFRSWGRGDWCDQHWNGGWNGGRDDDAGEYVILSAQCGSELRDVDVTDRLREMARQDRSFRLNYGAFDVDPDQGYAKSRRISARGPNGREAMFEFRDNSLIGGPMFRGWGGGEWG